MNSCVPMEKKVRLRKRRSMRNKGTCLVLGYRAPDIALCYKSPLIEWRNDDLVDVFHISMSGSSSRCLNTL